ncbi:MAG: TetR family transcriptional regulator [Janthinobacterium lividum]
MRRTKEDALHTRDTILDTAEQVFFEKGVSRTSLTDIASAAGLTRGAIYWHFKNKGDLFSAMCDRVLLPLDELIEASLDVREADPLGRFRELAIACLRDTALDARRHRAFDILFHKCEMIAEMGDISARRQANFADGRRRIEAALQNAVAKGQLPPQLDAHRAAIMVHALLGGLLADWLLAPEAMRIDIEAPQLIDACIDLLKLSPALQRPPA